MAKHGFSERMYLQYLRTKFTTLGMVSPQVAGKLAFDLFCTPYPKYKKRKAPAVFHQAKQIDLSIIGNGIKETETIPDSTGSIKKVSCIVRAG